MSLNVALFGAHGTGKTYIMDQLEARIRDAFPAVDVGRIDSVTRHIKSLGFPNNEGTTPQTQYLSGALQVIKERELERAGFDVILSDRCVIDRLCYDLYQMVSMDRQSSDYARLSNVHKTLVDLWENGGADFWDMVFYKPIHPDHVPHEDGDRSGSIEFQAGVDMAAKGMSILYLDFDSEYDPILPVDRDDCVDYLFTVVFDRLTEKGYVHA